MDVKQIYWAEEEEEKEEMIRLAQGTEKWWDALNKVMNFLMPQHAGNSLLSWLSEKPFSSLGR
jgi:hypothetical protein